MTGDTKIRNKKNPLKNVTMMGNSFVYLLCPIECLHPARHWVAWIRDWWDASEAGRSRGHQSHETCSPSVWPLYREILFPQYPELFFFIVRRSCVYPELKDKKESLINWIKSTTRQLRSQWITLKKASSSVNIFGSFTSSAIVVVASYD